MNEVITQPRTASFLGVLLALPFTLLLLIAVFNIDPMNSWMRNLLMSDSERMHAGGLFFLIATMILVPIGFTINVASVRKTVRLGSPVMAHPVNALLALALLAYIVALVGAFVIDQYPCWQDVPNCD